MIHHGPEPLVGSGIERDERDDSDRGDDDVPDPESRFTGGFNGALLHGNSFHKNIGPCVDAWAYNIDQFLL